MTRERPRETALTRVFCSAAPGVSLVAPATVGGAQIRPTSRYPHRPGDAP